jgi:hypothetical protein
MLKIFDTPQNPPEEEKALNPQTNLPAKNAPMDLNNYSPMAPSPSTYFGSSQYSGPLFSSARDLASYAEYNVPLSPYLDLDEKRAQNQSTAEKWGRGLMKAGVTTLGAVAENTLGIIAGLGELATGGQYYDNGVGHVVDGANEYMRETFPNYYTKAEQSPDRSLGDSMGTANFWADKAANGLGYTLGSIATMWLTGGTGPIMGTANAFSKGGQLLNTASRVARISRAGKLGALSSTGKSLDALSRSSRIIRGAQMLEAGAMMSLAEASVEARETRKMALDQLVNREIEEVRNAEGLIISKGDIPGERLKQLENEAIAAGNVAFGLNMAVLSATNIGMFGHLMRPGSQVAKRLPVAYSREAGEAVVNRLGQELPGWIKKTGRFAKATSPLVRNGLIEGIQEGSQFASNRAAILRAESKAFDGGTIDLVEALSEGFAETFGTAEGIEQTAIGVIVGLLGGSGGVIRNVKTRKDEEARINKVLELMSNNPLQDAVNLIEDSEIRSKIVNQLDEALKAGDTKTYNSLRDQLLTNLVNFHVDHGSFGTFKEQVKSVGDLSEEEFKKFFNMEELELSDVGINSPSDYANDLIKKIEVAEKRKRQIEDIFPSPEAQPKSLKRALEGKLGKEARRSQALSQALLKNKLYTMATQADLSAARRKSLADDILKESEEQLKRYTSLKAGPISRKSLDEKVEELLGPEGALAEAQKKYEEAEKTFRDDMSGENLKAYLDAVQVRNELVDTEMAKFIEEKTGISQKSNPLEWESISTKVGDYAGLSVAEMEANATLAELLNDPQQREIFREQLAKARESKAKARAEAREAKAVEKAKTAEDLDKVKTTSAKGEAAKNDRRDEFKKAGKEARDKFEAMSDEEFSEINEDELDGEGEKQAYKDVSKRRGDRPGKFDSLVVALQEAFAAYQQANSEEKHVAAGAVLKLVHQLEQNYIKKYPNQAFNPESIQEVEKHKTLMQEDGYVMGGEETATNLTYEDVEKGDYTVNEDRSGNTHNDEYKTEDGSPVVTYIESRPVMFPNENGQLEQIIAGVVQTKTYIEKPTKKDKKKKTDKKANPKKKAKTQTSKFKVGEKVYDKRGELLGTVLKVKGIYTNVQITENLSKNYRTTDLYRAKKEDTSETKEQNESELRQHIGKPVTITRGNRKGQEGEVIGISPINPHTHVVVEFETEENGETTKEYKASGLGFETETNNSKASIKDAAIRALQAVAEENNSNIELNEDDNTYVNTETGVVYRRVTEFIDPGTAEEFELIDEIKDKIEVKDGKFTLNLSKLSKTQRDRVNELQTDKLSGKEILLRIYSSSIVGTNMDKVMRDYFSGKEIKFEDYKRCD